MPNQDELKGLRGYQANKFTMSVIKTPKYTTVQRNALVVTEGSMVFDTDTKKMYYWNNTVWVQMSA